MTAGQGTAPAAVAGVILAGGRGARLGGMDKAHLRLAGETLLERMVGTYRTLFSEIVLAVREREGFREFGLPLATDNYPGRSPLLGIEAGLDRIEADRAFFAACDAPFLNPGLVRVLVDHAGPEWDVVIPKKSDGYFEPLCAVYSKACLDPIRALLESGGRKVIDFYPEVRVREVPQSLLTPHDPRLDSFFNINTPEDLARARAMAGR